MTTVSQVIIINRPDKLKKFSVNRKGCRGKQTGFVLSDTANNHDSSVAEARA